MTGGSVFERLELLWCATAVECIMDKLALIEAANEWLDHQERRRGLAHHTVETYASAIRCFARCLPSDYGDGDIDQAIHRRMTRASASTRKRTWDAMSLFCRWWEGTGGPPSPFADMVPPESSDAMRRPMSEIELRILVGALTETAAGPRPDGRRDVAIILCLLEAGFRIGDCTYLRVSDLDFRPPAESRAHPLIPLPRRIGPAAAGNYGRPSAR